MTRRLTLRTVAALAVACSLLLGGCGGEDSPGEADGSPTASSSGTAESPSGSATDASTEAPTEPATTATSSAAPALPDCSEVWVEGKRVPKPYRGCLEDDGRVSKSLHSCSMGASLAQYGKRFYGITGRSVVRATPDRNNDPTYLDLLATCTG